MKSTLPVRRFPAPWSAYRESADCFSVRDASGFQLLRIYCRDDLQKYTHGHTHLNSEEARRIACAIAMIPELMMPAEFAPRGQGVRWNPHRPFHVAVEDMFVRAKWSWMEAMCRFNEVPMRPTGEKIEREGLWRVYEFEHKRDAIMFWNAFSGRWLLGNEFFYPQRKGNLPTMKQVKNWDTRQDGQR